MDGYEGPFTSESEYHHQSNHCFEGANQSIDDDQEYNSKRIRLSPDFDHQGGGDVNTDGCEQSSPLGLRLRKTPSFLNLVQRSLFKGNRVEFFYETDNRSTDHDFKLRTDSLSQEKLKASNFPAIFIKIGVWQRTTRHEGDLTAKLYYAKRKLVWEVLDGALKSKIEIQWSDIIGIRAITHDTNEAGILEIELNQPPSFYREINPQPRKHTLWQQASDFTGGQAPIWRRHYVCFPPGVLDKHYEKLLQCDQRLFDLSQKPFPSHESPYFDPTMFGISELSLDFNRYGSAYLPGMRYPRHTYSTAPTPLRLSPNSSTSLVTEMPFHREAESNNEFLTRAQTTWESNVNNSNEGPFNSTSERPSDQLFNSQNYQPNLSLLDDIENHLLGEPSNVNVNYNANCSETNYHVSSDAVNYSANCPETNYHVSSDTNDQVMQYARYINPTLDVNVYSEELIPPLQNQNDDDIITPFVHLLDPNNRDFF